MKTANIFLFFFVLCSTLNGVPMEVISVIGKYGKILVPFLGSIYLVFFVKMKFRDLIPIFMMILLFWAGSFNYYLQTEKMDSFLNTALFSLYLIFLYLYTNILYIRYRELSWEYIVRRTLKVILNAILIGMMIGFVVIVLNHIPLYEIDNMGRRGFGGIYHDRMRFGLLSATVYLIAFSMLISGKRLIHRRYIVTIMLIFALMILLSETRTVQIILFISIVFWLLIKIMSRFHISLVRQSIFFLIIMLIVLIYNIYHDFSIEKINELSSGRFFIWSLASEHLTSVEHIFSGVLNLNSFILDEYKSFSYYFQKIDFLYLHSSLLEITAAGSFLALGLFVWINYKFFVSSKANINIIILSILSASFFESFLIMPHVPLSLLFWLFILMNIQFKNQFTDKEGKK